MDESHSSAIIKKHKVARTKQQGNQHMTSEDPRIEQFKQMAEADPNNELGHFSLGKAYLEANQFDNAIPALSRALEINPKLSKAYQCVGQSHDSNGNRAQAIDVLTKGVSIADAQGDRMPRDAMIKMLNDWGAPIPALSAATETRTGGASDANETAGFSCCRCNRPSGKMDKAPFKGDLGVKIFEHVCANCWQEWIPMGTKVINELGLVLSTPAGQAGYDQYMIEFLQLEDR
jgi:Fe-S cluster biosynthesis and repair protein YggX